MLNDTISQQRKDLWTTEAKFHVLEEASRSRSLTKQEQSLLASKDQVLQLARQKALLGDQITAQEQLNKRMDTSQKYVTQMAEKQAALLGGAGMSDRQAQRELAKSQLAAGWQNTGGSLDEEGYQKQLKAANDYYDAEDQLRGDWLTGAKKGWAEFEDSATNVYSQVQTVTSNAFTGMASTLTDFFTTGKSNFSDFLSTFLIRNKYRTGDGCDYAGIRYFDKNNNPVSDPSLDECNGTLTACKLRFGEHNELPFGGFPGTSLIRS